MAELILGAAIVVLIAVVCVAAIRKVNKRR